MINSLFKTVFLFIVFAFFTSCVSPKKIIYLQDMDSALPTQELHYTSVIKKDDILRITVNSEHMLLVQPFNQTLSGVSQNGLNAMGQQQLFGYLVDNKGAIAFPVLGIMKAAGKTRKELTDFIQAQIREGFVNDAVVDIRIVNFKVTVLGEVNRPGTFTLDHNRITLLQAIGTAGDLTIYGNRKNIKLLRDVNGIQTTYQVDLTSASFIDSDFYFLQQNDVVVIEPNYAQIQAAGVNRNASLFVSIAALLLSVIVIISRS
jgi:polysaccharide export outer membrane protein